MHNYANLNIIGQGAFGNAYLGHHVIQGQDYVIKRIQLNGKNKEQIQNIYNQVKLLEQFKHVNIVSYKQSIKEGQQLNIVMQFCSGGDMNQLIVQQKQNHGGRKLQERKVLEWAAQIALAIFYMHDKRILHRDLKTPNIFILDKKVKLGDFGISKVLDEKQDLASTSIGTPYYMSPEQYRHRPYSYKSDMWAFGCILYEMCNQKRPFQALSLQALAIKVLQARFSPVSEYYSKELRELISKMLQKKQKDRPSILQFLQAPIIKKKAAAYLKQTYNTLLKQNGDKVLIEGVLYQAKKLGISFPQKISSQSAKKLKPELSVQNRKQQKEIIKKKLQAQLLKLKQQTQQQSIQLTAQMQERRKIEKGNNPLGRKSSQSNSSSKSFKEQSTAISQQKNVAPLIINPKVEQKPKQFQLKQKYDMYEMQFQDQGDDSEEEIQPVRQVIVEVEEEDQKPYEKEKYIKSAQKQTKDKPQESKESRPQSRFTQLAPQQNPSTVSEPQMPIEQKINNLKEGIRNNMERANTIQNQISNIDFSISSSEDDELEKNIQPSKMPNMKKRQQNPAYLALTDQANDLQIALENILPKKTIKQLTQLAKSRRGAFGRGELVKVVGEGKVGAYHLAFELVKLNSMLQRIPQYC